MPLASPTKTRPPKTVGVPCAVVTPGNPKAHLSLSLGVVWLVSPAAFAFWKRVLAASDQPVQEASAPDRRTSGQGAADAVSATAISANRRIIYRSWQCAGTAARRVSPK